MNGMVIGCGMRRYRGLVNASMVFEMTEKDWYHIPNTLYNIEAKSYNDERPGNLTNPTFLEKNLIRTVF